MERDPAGAPFSHRVGPTIVTDPDDPDYLGPATIPLGEIVLFAPAECPSAEIVRAILRARGLAWREVDANGPTAERLRTEQFIFTGYFRTPVLCACGYAVVGFDEPRIHEILDLHQARLARLARIAAQDHD